MKCEYCPALKSEGYEYPEYYCSIYPEDDCMEFKDGTLGCRHKRKTIETRLEQYEDFRAHEWDGFAEWYEEDLKIENAVKEAVRDACDLTNLKLAYPCENGLHEIHMDNEIPSLFQDFVFRLRNSLEKQGFIIVKKEERGTNDGK